MRIRLFGLIIIAVFVLGLGVPVGAQQKPETIEEITASIQKLEAIDNNPSTPPDIRDLNRSFLAERRAQLLTLLVEKRQARRDYLSTAMTALTADQITRVEQEIGDLDRKIKQLQSSPSRSGTSDPAGSGDGSSNTNGKSDPGAKLNTAPDRGTAPTAITPNNNPIGMNSSITTGGQQTPTTNPGAVAPATQGRQFRGLLGGAVQTIQNKKAGNPAATIDLRDTFMLLAVSLTEETRKDVVADFTSKAEEVKTDKQTGSSSGGATTSLVTKAGIPAIFGLAVENGALTRTDNKTGITFSGTPVGIIQTLAKKGYIESYQNDDSFDRFLRNFSFKISFDPSRGSTPGTFTGSGQQLTGYSLRYKILDQRDPRDKKYTSQWSNLVETRAVPVTITLFSLFSKLYLQPTASFKAWQTETEAAVAAATPPEVEKVLTQQLEKLRKVDLGIEVNSLISTFSNQFDSFLKSRDDILNQVNAGWSSTIEYNNERRVGLPSLSNIKFIAEKGAYNGSLDLTANASVTFLNSTPTGSTMKRLRDYSFSGQLDVPLGNVVTTGKFFLSFAGQFERLASDEKAGAVLMASKGNIGIGQVKLTIPIRGTALKIPLSISFANRTELIKEKHVRGNFGITFDLDSILAKFNPFTQK